MDKSSLEKYSSTFPIMAETVIKNFFFTFSPKEFDNDDRKANFVIIKLREIEKILEKKKDFLEETEFDKVTEKMLDILNKIQKYKKKNK